MGIDTQLHQVAGGELAAGKSGLGAAYPEEWWRSRSSDELRELINRGFAGGDLFTGATAEAARRSSEAQLAADLEAAEAAMRRRSRVRKILLLRILVGLSLLVTLFATVVVIMQLGE
jgi:hypothetical protein